jgi:hypothetical protein
MKIIPLFLLLSLGTSLVAFPQTRVETKLYNTYLHGRVKSVKELNVNNYCKISQRGSGLIVLEKIYRFDESGDLTEFTIKYPHDCKMGSVTKYKRFGKDLVIETEIHNLQGELLSKTNYYNDKERHCAVHNYYDSDSSINYVYITNYDDNNRLIESATYDNSGELADRVIFKYNDIGLEEESTVLFVSGGVEWVVSKEIYIYNGQDRSYGKVYRNNGDSLNEEIGAWYNDMGEITEYYPKSQEDGGGFGTIHKYDEFDARKNWCRQRKFVDGIMMETVIIREIEYY